MNQINESHRKRYYLTYRKMRQNDSSLIFHKVSNNLKSHNRVKKEVAIRLLLNGKNELIKDKENTVFKSFTMKAGFG